MDSRAGNLPVRSKRLQRRVLPLVVLAALATCESVGPTVALPDQAVAFVAPPEYQTWWTQTEACSGRQGPREGIARSDHPPEYFGDRCHLTWESWGG